MINTSQDPDYVGPTGFERKVRQTHWQVMTDKTWRSKPGRWVYVGVGRYKLEQTMGEKLAIEETPDGGA